MDKHESLVREIAQEMANACNAHGVIEDLTPDAKEDAINFYTPAARVAVKRMEKMFRSGYAFSEIEPIWVEHPFLEEEMRERGLIPSPKFHCEGGIITGNGSCTTHCGYSKCYLISSSETDNNG